MDLSSKWLIDLRNKLADIAYQFDSAAAIEGAKLTPQEREKFKKHILAVIKPIDKEWFRNAKKESKKKTKK